VKGGINSDPVAVSGGKCVQLTDDIFSHGNALEVVGGCKSSIMESDKLTRSLAIGYLCDTNGGVCAGCHRTVCCANCNVMQCPKSKMTILSSICWSVV
jgi:hypothetical protein